MRNIIFRGKCKDKWVIGNLVVFEKNNKEDEVIYIVDKDMVYKIDDTTTLNQYTGLNDCNNNKIFENDILQDVYCHGKPYLGGMSYVYYDKDTSSFRLKYGDEDYGFNDVNPNSVEVIGNYTDNKNLYEDLSLV